MECGCEKIKSLLHSYVAELMSLEQDIRLVRVAFRGTYLREPQLLLSTKGDGQKKEYCTNVLLGDKKMMPSWVTDLVNSGTTRLLFLHSQR